MGMCSLPFFLDCLIPALMGPLASPIAQSLSLTRPELGAVFSANLAGQCLGLVTIPLAANRLGHRGIILWTTLGFGICQLLTTFVVDRDTLVASRFITGVFLGGALPSCVAAVTQGTPPARRGLATMLLFTAFGLGGAAAGFLGTAAPRSRFIDILKPPMLSGTLLLWLMFICALTIYYCLSSWLPTLLVDIGRSARLAAVAVGSYTSGGVVAGLLIGPLIDRFGAHRVLGLSFAISAVLLFVIGQSLQTLADWPLLLLLGTCGFFMLGAYGGINVVLAGYYPGPLRALGVGWAKSIGRLGTILPPIAIGHAMSAGMDPQTLVSLFAAPAALIVVALVIIPRRTG